MNTALVKQRGRNSLGKPNICIQCPTCKSRHWLPADQSTAICPRRPGTTPFTITERSNR
jgi:hypothetical protein